MTQSHLRSNDYITRSIPVVLLVGSLGTGHWVCLQLIAYWYGARQGHLWISWVDNRAYVLCVKPWCWNHQRTNISVSPSHLQPFRPSPSIWPCQVFQTKGSREYLEQRRNTGLFVICEDLPLFHWHLSWFQGSCCVSWLAGQPTLF